MGNQGRYCKSPLAFSWQIQAHKLSAHPKPTGRGTHDVTAYHPDQGSWGEDREDRPDILFQYEKVKKPETELNVQKNPGFLEHQGRIVLAPEASGRTPYRPVLDYPEIPLTLSSVGQGWLMEAISRLNESIILQDFQDRMPFDSQPSINALSMKRSRYRWSSGSLSWNKREGGKVMKDYLDKLIPKHLLRINTTKGLRDLNDDEQEAMRALNKGKYPERRRNKTPPAESGPSSKTKTGKEKAESRSHSRARSRSPRPSPQPQRPDYHRRTPTPEHEETGKGKIVAQGSDREAIQEQQPEQTEGDIDWRDEAPDTYDEVRTVYFALMRTRLQNSFQTGAPTPRTDQHESYNEQWDMLRRHFNVWWAASGNYVHTVPQLVKCGPWPDGFPDHFLNYQGAHAPIEADV